MAESTCAHCGKRIVTRNYMGEREPVWTHQPVTASFQDDEHRYCHLTTAAPPATVATIDPGGPT